MSVRSLVFGSLLSALPLLAQAQSADSSVVRFTPLVAPGCTDAEVRTSEELDWYVQDDCVDVLLEADDETFTFKNVAGPGGTDFVTAVGRYELTVPGDSTSFYSLDAGVTAPAGEFDLRRPVQLDLTSFGDGFSELRIAVYPFGGGETCPGIIRGGSTVTLERIFAAFNEGTAGPRDISTKLYLTFTPVEGAVFEGTLVVPDSAAQADSGYVYELPAGTVQFGEGFVVVDLETPASEPQDITLTKRGGLVVVAEGHDFVGGNVVGSTAQHAVTVDLDSLVICLRNPAEFPAPTNGRLVLDNVDIQYGGKESCLTTPPGTTLEVAAGATQTFGEHGLGLQQWQDESTLLVSEDAEVTFDGTFSVGDGREGLLDIRAGARVRVTPFAEVLESSPGRIRVKVAEGATFDLGDANSNVKALFVVEQLGDSTRGLDVSAYELTQNPVRGGEAVLRAKPDAARLTRIELLDTTGRVVNLVEPTAAKSEYRMPVPKTGLHSLRLTDANGLVGTIQVHGGN